VYVPSGPIAVLHDVVAARGQAVVVLRRLVPKAGIPGRDCLVEHNSRALHGVQSLLPWPSSGGIVAFWAVVDCPLCEWRRANGSDGTSTGKCALDAAT
jgi:hypothetical protein